MDSLICFFFGGEGRSLRRGGQGVCSKNTCMFVYYAIVFSKCFYIKMKREKYMCVGVFRVAIHSEQLLTIKIKIYMEFRQLFEIWFVCLQNYLMILMLFDISMYIICRKQFFLQWKFHFFFHSRIKILVINSYMFCCCCSVVFRVWK